MKFWLWCNRLLLLEFVEKVTLIDKVTCVAEFYFSSVVSWFCLYLCSHCKTDTAVDLSPWRLHSLATIIHERSCSTTVKCARCLKGLSYIPLVTVNSKRALDDNSNCAATVEASSNFVSEKVRGDEKKKKKEKWWWWPVTGEDAFYVKTNDKVKHS